MTLSLPCECTIGPLSLFSMFLKLIFLNLIVACKSLKEYLRVVYRYYGCKAFRQTDLALLRRYLFINPYRIHKQFLMERGSGDLYSYGESYLTSFAQAMQAARVSADDHFVELGSARGRNGFWLQSFVGCHILGIEQVPFFVEQACSVVKQRKLQKISFQQGDFLESDLSQATLVYVDATLMENEEIVRLLPRLEKMAPGSRVVGVNLSLVAEQGEGQGEKWSRIDRLELPFLWGVSEVAIFQRLDK